jgi:hypothetical protein
MHMNTVKATWKNGQIVPESPVNWHEGSHLLIHEVPGTEIEFMTEEEQSDDPAAIERWIQEVRAIPALPLTPEEEAAMLTWFQKVREFNLEAVRRQMAEGIP